MLHQQFIIFITLINLASLGMRQLYFTGFLLLTINITHLILTKNGIFSPFFLVICFEFSFCCRICQHFVEKNFLKKFFFRKKRRFQEERRVKLRTYRLSFSPNIPWSIQTSPYGSQHLK